MEVGFRAVRPAHLALGATGLAAILQRPLLRRGDAHCTDDLADRAPGSGFGAIDHRDALVAIGVRDDAIRVAELGAELHGALARVVLRESPGTAADVPAGRGGRDGAPGLDPLARRPWRGFPAATARAAKRAAGRHARGACGLGEGAQGEQTGNGDEAERQTKAPRCIQRQGYATPGNRYLHIELRR